MMTAWWQPANWKETGTRATAFIRNGKGTARLWINDVMVLETHGNRCGVGDHWEDESTGIIDLALILQDEAYAQGEKELQKFINQGFNTATITEDTLDVEKGLTVAQKTIQSINKPDTPLPVSDRSLEIEKMFYTPPVSHQLELFEEGMS